MTRTASAPGADHDAHRDDRDRAEDVGEEFGAARDGRARDRALNREDDTLDDPPGARPAAWSLGAAVNRSSITTTDPDVAGAVLGRLYSRVDFEREPGTGFRLQLSNVAAGPLLLSRAHHGFAARALVQATDDFATIAVNAGAMDMTFPHRPRHTLRTGQVSRWDDEEPFTGSSAPGATVSLLRLPVQLIAEHTGHGDPDTEPGSGAGGPRTSRVRFLGTTPVNTPAERYWAELTAFAYRQAMAAESPLHSPLIRSQLIHSLATAALIVFPNTSTTTDHVPGPGHTGPATVRRALEHLHAHAGEPLTVTDLAAAAGIGVRALQQAFVQHLGSTPTAHLRQVRLERAHQDLQAADPRAGDTVAAVAVRWGFAHTGRFAAAYQQRYGTSPATTLRT